jgi:hypothetical protein
MYRLFSSLFANRTPRSQRRRSPARSAGLRLEPLEGRELPAVIAAGEVPQNVARNQAAINTFLGDGDRARAAGNEALAVTYYNDAAKTAFDFHNPTASFQLAQRWAALGGSYYSSVAATYYSYAVGECYYWMEPNQGTGSGTDYAYGYHQLKDSVIRSAGTLERELGSTSSPAESVRNLAENAASYVSLLDEAQQYAPPMAGGTWQVNIGGVEFTYTITQHVGYAAGKITGGGRTGSIDYTNIQPIKGYPNWFGTTFTINWSDGTKLEGYAEQYAGNNRSFNSGEQLIALKGNTGYSNFFTATRTSAKGWTAAGPYE